ncbi:MAG: prepilin peptidase [Candidatus Diapherotrites archaeon]|nr:prepilin peptidase [Candidatus Diapherotrites archaeon]
MPNMLLALAGLALASLTDLRERIVPDWLSYSMIGAGLAYHAGLSVMHWSAAHFVLSLISTALAFAFGYALWRVGAWAGGDVKLFTGIGALVPLLFPYVAFLNSIVLSFPFLMLFVFFRTATVPALHKLFSRMLVRGTKRGFGLAALGLALGFVMNPLFGVPEAVAVVGSSLFVAMFWEVLSYGRREALRRRVPVSGLEEGMISAESLYVEKGKVKHFSPTLLQKLTLFEPKNTVASMYLAGGLEKKEITALRRYGVKSLWVREGMPMVPVLFAGALVAALFGNLALMLFELF